MGAIEAIERAGRSDTSMTAETGVILAGRYRLSERIGSGSSGEVYRADDLAFARAVALRLLTPALSREADVIDRLQARLHRAARMLRDDVRSLSDIVDVIDLGRTDDGRVFVVTELLPGASLAAALADEGPVPWRRLRSLMVRACQIVHLSHEHGLVRQDLQTRHLYPVRDKSQPGTLRIYSPGLGVAFGQRLWSCLDLEEWRMLARYAAPEQISGGEIDRRTDVYALGVILYECLTGRPPFADPRPAYVLAAHLLTPVPPFPLGARARGVPPELERIVLRALAKAPEDRWPTVKALANAMAALELGLSDASGVLEVGELGAAEPATSVTTMRVDSARLSGRPGLAPVPGHDESTAIPGDIDPTQSESELAWREILEAAEEAVGAVASAAEARGSAATVPFPGNMSESSGAQIVPFAPDPPPRAAARLVAVPPASALPVADDEEDEEPAPPEPVAMAERSAMRWPIEPAPASTLAPRRSAERWALAAALALVTAAGVTYALRPESPDALPASLPPAAAVTAPSTLRTVVPASAARAPVPSAPEEAPAGASARDEQDAADALVAPPAEASPPRSPTAAIFQPEAPPPARRLRSRPRPAPDATPPPRKPSPTGASSDGSDGARAAPEVESTGAATP